MAKVLKKLELFSRTEGSELTITAAKDDGEGNRRFSMVAYTGGKMMVGGWYDPVIVDLNGLSIKARKPIFFGHQTYSLDSLIGQTDKIAVEGNRLIAEGEILGESETVKKVIALHDRGYNWQASIGAVVQEYKRLEKGEVIEVNGRRFSGPVTVVTKAALAEISFVMQGADDNTSAKIAANNVIENELETVTMPNEVKNDLKAEGQDTNEVTASKPQAATVNTDEFLADLRAKAAVEAERIAMVHKHCGETHLEIAAKAIKEGWNEDKVKLEVLQASRPTAPNVIAYQPVESMNILEAAALMAGGISGDDLLKSHGEKTVEAAAKRFRRIGLQQLLLEAARANGCSQMYFRDNPRAVLQAAFSTMDLPGIMSNIANKFLLQGFNSEEAVWREIARIRSVSDFKTITSYRMTGAFEFDEIGPTGELKHGDLGEESFTNRAKTHGKMFSITREDIYNDDLDALTAVPAKIGRGGHKKLNKVFWTEFLDNAAFFTEARGNYDEGADTALSVDGLAAAELLFLEQTDADGAPLGVDPKILLVPNALSFAARQLMASVKLGDTSGEPDRNIYAGQFKPLASRYLGNASYAGSSSKAWYLLADPNDLATMEVCFLNGNQTPIVESADADFNVLGIQMRGYFDFGCAKQEWRAGVKMKGSV
jgi:hypothetical protein